MSNLTLTAIMYSITQSFLCIFWVLGWISSHIAKLFYPVLWSRYIPINLLMLICIQTRMYTNALPLLWMFWVCERIPSREYTSHAFHITDRIDTKTNVSNTYSLDVGVINQPGTAVIILSINSQSHMLPTTFRYQDFCVWSYFWNRTSKEKRF